MLDPTVIGVDPGIVHTGVVSLDFNVEDRELDIHAAAIDGPNALATGLQIQQWHPDRQLTALDIFIEWYRPRSGFSVDERMVQANGQFRTVLHGNLLRNTGVKKVVTQELMELLHCWKFSTTTHHQDIRSAARIAILGMMLDPALNQVLYTFTTDNIDGRDWNVTVN
jgi:hypothetical protein